MDPVQLMMAAHQADEALAAQTPDQPLQAAIAQSRPDLWAALSRNPATYPDLLSWLASTGNVEVIANLRARGFLPADAVAPGVPVNEPGPAVDANAAVVPEENPESGTFSAEQQDAEPAGGGTPSTEGDQPQADDEAETQVGEAETQTVEISSDESPSDETSPDKEETEAGAGLAGATEEDTQSGEQPEEEAPGAAVDEVAAEDQRSADDGGAAFAGGRVSKETPVTGARRISGSCASLAGLEKAVEEGDEEAVELAVARIALMYAVISGYGGVPLLYMGDELGMFNDMHYVDDPSHAEDNRWAHRPFMDWDLAKAVETDTASPAGRVNAAIRHILAVRTATTQIHAATPSVPVESPEHRLLILERNHPLGKMVQVYNFTGETVSLRHDVLAKRVGFDAHELLGGYDWDLRLPRIDFAPYQAAWFVGAEI